MRSRFPWAIASFIIVVAFGCLAAAGSCFAQDAPAVPPPPMPADPTADAKTLPPPVDGDEKLVGAEVLTRGPVHEAFATPTQLDPEPTPTIAKKPPEAIEEVPPDERPEGDNVVWIPGYWAWDDERNDFLWVSGLYRNAPPKQTWVSGYWNQVAGGYQWVPGFWTTVAKEEVAYIEQAPPASIEAGPSSPAPSDNHFWIPGCWMQQDVKYVWRPGYWSVAQPNWIWMPAHYVWCPSGYVFVPGYWDYLPAQRGVLFAPVYFTQPIYYQPAFVYRPAVVISSGFFSANLFCRPTYCHYYFGDYFAAQYTNVGYRPWFSLNVNIGGRPCYDPFFTYYSWHNRGHDHDWLARTQQRYHHLQKDEHARPPHTFAAVQKSRTLAARGGRDDVVIARTVREAKNDHDGPIKLHDVDRTERAKFVKEGQEARKLATNRREVEHNPGAVAGHRVDRPHEVGKTDEKSIVRVSDKKLRLPPSATSVATTQHSRQGGEQHENGNRRDIGGRAMDSAKRTGAIDRSKNTDAANVANVEHGGKTEGINGKQHNRPHVAANQSSTDLPQSATSARHSDRTPQHSGAQGRAEGVDRAKIAIDRARNDGPQLNQPDVTRRPITGQNDLGGGQAQSLRNEFSERQPRRGKESVDWSAQNNSATTTPLGPATSAFPRNSGTYQQQLNSPSQQQYNRLQHNAPQMQQSGPTNSFQPRPQPSNNALPNGGVPAQRGNGGDEHGHGRRHGRSAEAESPRSNIDIAAQAPSINNIPGKVKDELKSTRTALEGGEKDEFADRVRQVVRGTPDEDLDGPASDRASKRSTPPSDLRVPSLYGPTSPQPNQRGITQTDSSDREAAPLTERNASNRSSGGRVTSSSSTPRESADGARPGAAPRSRYDSLVQQGQTLSRSTIKERPGTVDENGNVDPRKTKDPIGSIGFGATPRRYGTQRVNGALGQSSGGSGGTGSDQGLSRGLGNSNSLPHWQPSSLPKMQRMQRGGGTPAHSNNPVDRTYDPTRR